jgi:two-component system, NtrC family, response regulator
MGRGSRITATHLRLAEAYPPENSIGLRQARQRAEAESLRQALAQTGSNLSQAAKLLGISRPTLYSLLRQHGIGTSRLLRREILVSDHDSDRAAGREGIDGAE